MDVLSTTDGSAQAVREAAAASEAFDTRAALERELDRLSVAIGAHATASAQHLQWTLLAQGFLLTSYLIVLIGGWSLPLPGKRWLLAGVAGYAVVSLVLGHLSQKGSRDRISPLRQGRRLVEQALERIASRPVVFSRDGVIARSVGDWATTLMPVAALAGWVTLTLYTLALPLPFDARTSAEVRGAARSAVLQAQPPVASVPRGKGSPRRGEEPATAVVAAETPAQEESGLAALFRRAINAPSAEVPSTGETVKP